MEEEMCQWEMQAQSMDNISSKARDSAPSHKYATGKTVSYKQVIEASHSYRKPEGFL